MRERTLGNSSVRLAKQLKENHSEEWLVRYFGECADFVARPSLFPVVCQELPERVAVPAVLKIDSTKKANHFSNYKTSFVKNNARLL